MRTWTSRTETSERATTATGGWAEGCGPLMIYPQPGGLSWEQLEDLTDAAIGAGGCAGASVVIYNPDLDRDGTGAGRIARFGGSIARSAAR